VFLLLLCNDRAVLGPWVNSRQLNLFTGAVIVGLVILSMILTLSVLFPGVGEKTIVGILIAGSVLAVFVTVGVKYVAASAAAKMHQDSDSAASPSRRERDTWRMPPLNQLSPARLTQLERTWLIVLRAYLIVAGGLVLIRIVMLATAGT
jgi:hypothetical protein